MKGLTLLVFFVLLRLVLLEESCCQVKEFVCEYREMRRLEEQRTNLRFLVGTGLTPKESWNAMKRVYGTDCMALSTVQKWHKRFHEGETSVKDHAHTGHPRSARSDANVLLIRGLIAQDGRRTVRKLGELSGLLTGTVHQIIKRDLQYRQINAKFVPRLLMDKQKAFRKRLCEDNLFSVLDDDMFLSRVVTGDKTWVSTFDPETKNVSMQWMPKGSKRPQKAIRGHTRTKLMLTLFFDQKGILLIQFNRPRDTINTDSYCATLVQLKENIRRKRDQSFGSTMMKATGNFFCCMTTRRPTLRPEPLAKSGSGALTWCHTHPTHLI